MEREREAYINSVNLNSHTEFPYLVLDVVNDRACPKNPGFRVMHWHEDLQLIYVLEGMIEVQTLDSAVQVRAGEGLFINQNVVHDVRRLGSCHYNSFLFPAYFLGFYAGSPVKALVDSIVENEQLPFFHFSPAVCWQGEVVELLRQLAGLEGEKTSLYAYEVLLKLSSLWLVMTRHIAVPERKKMSVVHLRIQKILRYIEEHFGEEITLAELAKSANISKSECLRCFQLSLHTTPCQYLLEFRLSKAAQLLRTTEEPIGEIAAAVGFHQMSHFGKRFKGKTGYTPKEYRRAANSVGSAAYGPR